jgi:hypothetical protein
MTSVNIGCADCTNWATETELARAESREARRAAAALDELCDAAKRERNEALDRAEKMHLLGLKLARELADLERENASLRRRLREGGR